MRRIRTLMSSYYPPCSYLPNYFPKSTSSHSRPSSVRINDSAKVIKENRPDNIEISPIESNLALKAELESSASNTPVSQLSLANSTAPQVEVHRNAFNNIRCTQVGPVMLPKFKEDKDDNDSDGEVGSVLK